MENCEEYEEGVNDEGHDVGEGCKRESHRLTFLLSETFSILAQAGHTTPPAPPATSQPRLAGGKSSWNAGGEIGFGSCWEKKRVNDFFFMVSKIS